MATTLGRRQIRIRICLSCLAGPKDQTQAEQEKTG
jgi:hypothetical protein